jgi:hypothetical protein
MSQRLDGSDHCRTTDHSDEITMMRYAATAIRTRYPDSKDCPYVEYLEARVLDGAADLLEVHDATGISLDDWDGPRKLVETAMRILKLDHATTFLTNGV